MKKTTATAEGYSPKQITEARAARIMRLTREQALTDAERGATDRRFLDKQERAERIASGKYRKPTRAELLELMDEQGMTFRDKLAAIEGMLGGLALLRIGAEHGDGWIKDGMEDALEIHFAEIEKILEAGRKVYAANIETMRKAIA